MMTSAYLPITIALAALLVVVGGFAAIALRRRAALARELREQARNLASVNAELKVAEARLRAIVDSSLEAIITIDPQNRILDWNRRAEEIFGWPAGEVLGRRLDETIVPVRYREAHLKGIERYLATGIGPMLNRRVEVEGLRRDGSEFPLELTISDAGEGNELIFSAFIRDIEGRKTVERWTAAEHDVVRIMAESRTIEEAAPAVLERIGETLGWDVGVFWIVDRRWNVLNFVALWCRGGQEVPEFAAVDRGTQFVPGMGLPGRVWQSRSAHWIPDLETDVDFPRVHAAMRDGLRSAVGFPILSGGECLAVMEFFRRRPLPQDDILLDVLFDIGAGIGESMRRIQAEEDLGVAMRRTEQANVELERRRSEAERARAIADEASRAKSDFLANMSHELRTPLNAIMGYTDLLRLQLKGPLTEGQITQVERVQNSSRHLLALIEDILDLSKIEAGRMTVKQEPAPVAGVVQTALAVVAPQAAERRISVREDCGDDVRYLGDEHRVRQILLNLLSNAVKFTEPGGRIVISCGQVDGLDVDAAPEGPGPWSYIRVEDTGIGIGPNEGALIFEPFVQAEMGHTRTRGGTGLGLTISRRLARLMGGDLTLKSERGVGSTFTLWLPSPEIDGRPARSGDASLVSDALQDAGSGLRRDAEHVLAAVDARLRVDPLIPEGPGKALLRDHQQSLLEDVAQSLTVLAAARRHPEVLRESSGIGEITAAKHGEQRATLGWDAQALQREFTVFRDVVANDVRARISSASEDVIEEVIQVLDHLFEAGCRSSMAALRRARERNRPSPP